MKNNISVIEDLRLDLLKNALKIKEILEVYPHIRPYLSIDIDQKYFAVVFKGSIYKYRKLLDFLENNLENC